MDKWGRRDLHRPSKSPPGPSLSKSPTALCHGTRRGSSITFAPVQTDFRVQCILQILQYNRVFGQTFKTLQDFLRTMWQSDILRLRPFKNHVPWPIEHQDTPSAEKFYGAGCCAASMNSLADSSFADAYVHVESYWYPYWTISCLIFSKIFKAFQSWPLVYQIRNIGIFCSPSQRCQRV